LYISTSRAGQNMLYINKQSWTKHATYQQAELDETLYIEASRAGGNIV